jgi:hypothetical protein
MILILNLKINIKKKIFYILYRINMSLSNFYLGSVDVNQNVNLYDALPPTVDTMPSTHYIINVDCNFQTLMGFSGNYVQSASNPNNVNINLDLSPNSDYLKLLLGYNEVYNAGNVVENFAAHADSGPSASGRKGSVTGITMGVSNIGFRLLEIAAIQIFSHAKARAAIRNDTEFTTSMQHIVDSIPNLVNDYTITEETKLEMYNTYVQQNLASLSDDVTSPVAFNWNVYNFNDTYVSGVQLNFNIPSIFDSAGAGIDRNLYGVGADPSVNILLRFVAYVNPN